MENSKNYGFLTPDLIAEGSHPSRCPQHRTASAEPGLRTWGGVGSCSGREPRNLFPCAFSASDRGRG